MIQTVREIAKKLHSQVSEWDPPLRSYAKDIQALAGHVLASTEPLGDELLRAIIYEPGYSVPYDLALRMATDIEKKAADIADLRAQLQAATMRAEAAGGPE